MPRRSNQPRPPAGWIQSKALNRFAHGSAPRACRVGPVPPAAGDAEIVVGRGHGVGMTNAPTATVVIERFLSARGPTVAPRTYDRDCEAMSRFREFADALPLPTIDELTARRLSRETGRSPSELELEAVLGLVEGIPDFFGAWLPTRRASPGQVAMTAIVIRIFGRWLLEHGLVDDDVAESLARYTQLYDHGAPRRTAIAIAADI